MTAKPFDGIRPLDYIASAYLAWDSIEGDRGRNRWLGLLALLIAVSLSVWMASVEVPKVDRAVAEKVPERLARLIMEKKVEPPPPPPKEEIKEEKPKEEPKPEAPREQQVEKAREKATRALSEAKKELSALQDLASAFDMGDAQPLTRAGAAAGGISRDMITSRSGKGSGGVNIGSTSSGGSEAGGSKLAAVQMAKVESNLGSGGIGPTRKNASGKLERTTEEIRRIIDRNNGALNAIYQRALRSNPTIKGTIIVRLVIAANGSVTVCEMVSSELGDPETERKLLSRLKAIDFGAIEGVIPWDDKYTINFFPS